MEGESKDKQQLEEIINSSPDPFVAKLLLTQLSEYERSKTNTKLPLLNTHPQIARYLARKNILTPRQRGINGTYNIAPNQFFGPILDVFNNLHEDSIKDICESYQERGAEIIFYNRIHPHKKTQQGITRQIQGIQRVANNPESAAGIQEAFEKHNPILVFGKVQEKIYLNASLNQNTKEKMYRWSVTVHNPASLTRFSTVDDTKRFLPVYNQTLRKLRAK